VQRVNSFLVIIILIVSVAFSQSIFVNAASKEEVEASLELANEFLKNNYGFSNDYFRENRTTIKER